MDVYMNPISIPAIASNSKVQRVAATLYRETPIAAVFDF